MPCLTCKNWDAKRTPSEMRKLHLARCALGPSWEFLPMQGSCERFAEATPDVVRLRLAWRDKVCAHDRK